MKIKFNRFILLIIIVFGVMSCGKKQESTVISRNFEGEIWGRFDYLEADFNVVKAPMTADLVMNIDISEIYPNIYPHYDADDGLFVITMTIYAPDGGQRSREYKFRLKDSDGNFKSEKIDGYYHYELPLISEMSFTENGIYKFKVENKYPREPLYGIKSLNINCLQIKRF